MFCEFQFRPFNVRGERFAKIAEKLRDELANAARLLTKLILVPRRIAFA